LTLVVVRGDRISEGARRTFVSLSRWRIARMRFLPSMSTRSVGTLPRSLESASMQLLYRSRKMRLGRLLRWRISSM
jgi:hypothetical protein